MDNASGPTTEKYSDLSELILCNQPNHPTNQNHRNKQLTKLKKLQNKNFQKN